MPETEVGYRNGSRDVEIGFFSKPCSFDRNRLYISIVEVDILLLTFSTTLLASCAQNRTNFSIRRP